MFLTFMGISVLAVVTKIVLVVKEKLQKKKEYHG